MSRKIFLYLVILLIVFCVVLTQPSESGTQEPTTATLAKDEKLETFDYHIAGMKKKGERRVVTVDLGHGVKLELVRIMKGSFKMGAPEDEADAENREKPLHVVELTKDYYLGKFEVTQEQYEEIMGKNPSRFKGAKLPVESVLWSEAKEFVERLSKKSGRTFSLPTEAEWEYACRAGTNTPFHFGNSLNGNEANFDGRYPYGMTTEGPYLNAVTNVGKYPPNAWGLHDMHGNVHEWCEDVYSHDYYKKSPGKDPVNVGRANDACVLRGGAWNDPARNCRAAVRSYGIDPSRRFDSRGFRVVCRKEKGSVKKSKEKGSG